MDGIFDPNGYLKKRVEESINELKKEHKVNNNKKTKKMFQKKY